MSKDSVKNNSICSSDYITGFSFDYIETYSLQRGEEYQAAMQVLKPEHNRLKVRKKNETISTKMKKFA